jgi:hypothetical protein
MPEVNGHKLATELLALPRRPVISILTGVEEPKLAKNLTTRGVERIFYKPLDFTEFAEEMLYLVEQRVGRINDRAAGNGTNSRPNAIEPLSRLAESSASGENEMAKVPNSATGNGEADTQKVLLGDLFPTSSNSLTAPEPVYQSAPTVAGGSDGHHDSDVHLSRAFSTRLEAELVRTKKALVDLQRTVAAGQNSSLINVLIALSAGLVFGLIAGLAQFPYVIQVHTLSYP